MSIPQSMQTFQYGAAVQLIVQFIDPVATAANNNVPVPLNISGAGNLAISLLYPDGQTSYTFSAAFLTDGSDGKIWFRSVYDVTLVQLGLFQIQGQCESGGVVTLTQKGYFDVESNTFGPGEAPIAPILNSSAFILFDNTAARWVFSMTVNGTVTPSQPGTPPFGALTFHAMVFQDQAGIYWTVTTDTHGTLSAALGGSAAQAIPGLILIDGNGIAWIMTVNEAGQIKFT